MIDRWLSKADQSIATARLALDHGDTAAACNRAYYGMFYAARAALLCAGHDEEAAAKTHAGLVSAFGRRIVLPGHIAPEQGHAFAVELKRRLIGDYEGAEMTRQDAELAIAHADDFVRAIRAWTAG